MGFSHADWQELQLNRDKNRFGSRQSRPPPMQLSILPQPERPAKKPRKPPEEPGYDRHQLRLW
jgi:hypothetical protein